MSGLLIRNRHGGRRARPFFSLSALMGPASVGDLRSGKLGAPGYANQFGLTGWPHWLRAVRADCGRGFSAGHGVRPSPVYLSETYCPPTGGTKGFYVELAMGRQKVAVMFAGSWWGVVLKTRCSAPRRQWPGTMGAGAACL